MGVNTKKLGFTIIETTIVLGISSLLMVAVLAGSSMAVNQQRYRDSVMSLLSLVQGEYLAVTRVQNSERTTNYDCNTGDASVSNGGVTPRGASECVIIGRVINVSGGKTIKASDVIGSRSVATPLPDNDIDALQSYQLSIFDIGTLTSEVAWGGAIVDPVTSVPETFGILLLRSPVSGSVITFISSTAITSTNLESVVNVANIQEKKMCVDSQSLFSGPRSGVIIQAGASGPNGVQQKEVGSGC